MLYCIYCIKVHISFALYPRNTQSHINICNKVIGHCQLSSSTQSLDVLSPACAPLLPLLTPIKGQSVHQRLANTAWNPLILVYQRLYSHRRLLSHLFRCHRGIHIDRWSKMRSQLHRESSVQRSGREPCPIVYAQEEPPEQTHLIINA